MYHLEWSRLGRCVIIRESDGAAIPPVHDNGDYCRFREWNAKQRSPLIVADREPDEPHVAELAETDRRKKAVELLRRLRAIPSDDRTEVDLANALNALIDVSG